MPANFLQRPRYPWEVQDDQQDQGPPIPGMMTQGPPAPPRMLSQEDAPPRPYMEPPQRPPMRRDQQDGPPPPQMREQGPPTPVTDRFQQQVQQFQNRKEPGRGRQILGGVLAATRFRGAAPYVTGQAGRERELENLKVAGSAANEEQQTINHQQDRALKEKQMGLTDDLRKQQEEDRRLKLLTDPNIEEPVAGGKYRGNVNVGGKQYGVLPPEVVAGRQASARKAAERENWLPVPQPLKDEFGLGETAPRETIDSVIRLVEARGRADEAAALRRELASQADTTKREIAAEGNQTRKDVAAATSGKGDTLRADKSYQFNVGQLNTIGKPVSEAIARLGRLQDTLAQNNPQADALIGPELLTVMAGGQGSGLRMNEAEIARVIGGRSNWETLKASINKWQIDPASARSITPAQQQQIRALVQDVSGKLNAKQALIDQAHQALIGTEDPNEHRRIVAGARQQFSATDQPVVHNAGATDLRKEQHSPSTGQYRYTLDGGQTWLPGRLPQR